MGECMYTKVCTQCKIQKNASEYNYSKKTYDRLSPACRECMLKRVKNNPSDLDRMRKLDGLKQYYQRKY